MAEQKVEQPKGPGGRGMRGMPRPKIENPGKLLARLMGLLFRSYGLQMLLVGVCIVVSVLASVQGTLFTRTLIDGYITPMMEQPTPDYGPLLGAIGRVAIFYLIGVSAAFLQSLTMM